MAIVSLVPMVAFGAPDDFPKPRGLVTQVEFWKKVFAQYSENQIVVHDNLYLDKIYMVIDLRPLAESGADDETLRRERRRRERREMKRVKRALRKLARGRYSPDDLGGIEREIWSLFRNVSGSRKFAKAHGRVRTQQGLRERFRRGLEVSRRYLPEMEEIFRREGLPVELTRLPFVESSFNVHAYSKVGAAGIWQFIPSSARIYLELNEIQDSRRDPIYATLGAAHHLRDDYAVLGSWPLAITAYNHGRSGIARAVSAVGSSDIVTIIKRYRGKSFRFASRNFYAEFLAALEVEGDYKTHFGEVTFEPRLRYQEVTIHDYLRFSTIAKLAGCSVEALQSMNPRFTSEVVEGKLYVPKGYVIRVPSGRAEKFDIAYAKLPARERFSRQRVFFVAHRVRRGQTVGSIAKRYGTTVAAIQGANGLRDPNRVRAGQVLKIPRG